MSILLKIILLLCLWLAPQMAQSATDASVRLEVAGGRVADVTTAAAIKAESDVQIRRIKKLLVSRKVKNLDSLFELLEKLQKNLRGQN